MNKSILIISGLDIWSMKNKSGALSLWLTLKGYSEKGWKVYFLISAENNNSKDNYYYNIEVKRLNSHFFRKLIGIKKVAFFIRPLWWLYFQVKMVLIGYKIAKENEIDVFYGYEIFGIPASKILSIVFKRPFVSRYQGTILKPKMKNKFWRIKHWHHYIGLKIPSDLIIMTNDGTQGDKVLSLLKKDMNKVMFWMNGINKDIYQPNFDKYSFKKNIGISKDTKILLTVSRLVYWKRLDRIIRAMPKIVSSLSGVKLLIVGDGPERKTLEKLVTSLSLNKHIIFFGSIPYNEIFNFYNSADLFISLYDLSNVGNPLLEAMVCGKCIVTLNNGDTGKFIKNEENGILLNIEDLNSLPTVVCDLLMNEKKRISLRQKAKEFAESHFWTWEERMDMEIKTVEELLK